jgi:hypothetical protein
MLLDQSQNPASIVTNTVTNTIINFIANGVIIDFLNLKYLLAK